MEYEKIKQLMEDMGNSKLTALDIDFPDGTKIRMKKEEKKIIEVPKNDNKHIIPNDEDVESDIENREKDINKSVEGNVVKSPMVGTFYAKSSPDSEAYVTLGQQVKKGDILCIIEAMKLMNEIESEFDGKIVEILVEDGEAVEYGMPLFVIE